MALLEGAALPEETVVSVAGTATAQPAAPGGVEITSPVIEALTDPAQPAPFDLYRPELRANTDAGSIEVGATGP